MKNLKESSELNSQPIDVVTSAIRGILGLVPIAGSLLAELAGTVIPNQRIDRITKFLVILDSKLSALEKDFVISQLSNESFSDFLEEGILQVVHSISDERREYIANLIAFGLSQQDIEYIELKYLLRILNEINDIEILWLRFYLVPTMDGDEEFRDKHNDVITPVVATMSDPLSVVEKEALQKSYKEHLSRLGLLRPQYKIDHRTNTPEFDSYTGGLAIRSYQITSLGRLLLEQIGLNRPNVV